MRDIPMPARQRLYVLTPAPAREKIQVHLLTKAPD
jgi:hypothetical protein